MQATYSYNFSFGDCNPQRLAVKLTQQAERLLLKQRHPWVFSDSIVKINKSAQTGDLAILFRQKDNRVLGIGLYDDASPIRIKMIHHGGSRPVNKDFFSEKIRTAYRHRQDHLPAKTNSFRVIFGENDGLPGLIADLYAHVLVVKLYSGIWFPYLKTILDLLIDQTQCDSVVLRLSRKLQATAPPSFKDGQICYGQLINEIIPFTEHGLHFQAHVIRGHKTGYFLDHRHNRRKVGSLARGKTVLDVFAYAGGFSVHALGNGAKNVCSVDVSEQALIMARENANRNPYPGRHEVRAGDAFTILPALIAQHRQFDIVVIDPPSFAKNSKETPLALKKYGQLATWGARLTAKKGMLVLASCSSRVPAADFFETNEKALQKTGRKFQLTDQTAHDFDHPITFEEGAYLKCGYYRMD